jgi:hypothetical protein
LPDQAACNRCSSWQGPVGSVRSETCAVVFVDGYPAFFAEVLTRFAPCRTLRNPSEVPFPAFAFLRPLFTVLFGPFAASLGELVRSAGLIQIREIAEPMQGSPAK